MAGMTVSWSPFCSSLNSYNSIETNWDHVLICHAAQTRHANCNNYTGCLNSLLANLIPPKTENRYISLIYNINFKLRLINFVYFFLRHPVHLFPEGIWIFHRYESSRKNIPSCFIMTFYIYQLQSCFPKLVIFTWTVHSFLRLLGYRFSGNRTYLFHALPLFHTQLHFHRPGSTVFTKAIEQVQWDLTSFAKMPKKHISSFKFFTLDKLAFLSLFITSAPFS